MHYGVKGMKWGVRRAHNNSSTNSGSRKHEQDEISDNKKKGLTSKQKRALKVGAAVVGTALATYGAYKVSKIVKNKHAERTVKKVMSEMTSARADYLNRSIANTQSHIDLGKRITSSNSWDHALNATIKSRQSAIKGDNALYGESSWYKAKFPNGRDATKEAKEYMYESLRNDYDYWVRRVKNQG